MTVAENLARVQEQIRDACRRAGRGPDEVTLIAVSKLQPDERVREAFAAGQRDFGENYVQGLVARKAMLPSARWHAIGHVQRNKAKGAVEADVIHTIDSIRIAEALEQAAAKRIDVLVEVNLGGEASKSGAKVEEVPAIVEALGTKSRLSLVGFMCIPPPEESRRYFAALRGLRDRTAEETGLRLPHLSMGMSRDFEDAIAEGATMVRVGTAVFGERPG
jgi:pyridoxal phosphate enzyme (YggS family)